jgi:TrmH family RNA methyltransferase
MIESSQNEVIKDIRRVRRSKGVEAVLEGPHLVLEALRLGMPLRTVLATAEFVATAEGREILESLPRPPLLAAGRILESLADADSPRGILAVCRLPRAGLEEVAPAPAETWLYLDGIQDPGNLGALARVAEGLGARGLLLSPGCADPNHARALRASAGSLLRVAVAVRVEAAAARELFSAVCARWIGLEAHRGSQPLDQLEASAATVLAVGSEGPGLSEATRAVLDSRVTIPLQGRLESLNVAVAAALVLARLVPAGRKALSPP